MSASGGAHESATMRRLVETIVRRLSDHPAEVRVVETFEGRSAAELNNNDLIRQFYLGLEA